MQNFLCRHLFPLCISPKGEQGLAAGEPKLCSQSGIATRLKSLVPRQVVRIMKLTAIILLATCLQVSANGYSQKITLSVKDAPLEQVFASIEKQSDYSFNYYHELIKQARPVTIQVKDATLEEVLAICFKEQPLTYKIINRLIIIKEEEQVKTGLQQQAIPPDPIEVRGIISDENGAPAQAVNVMVKGTNKGTTTNVKGEFILKNVDENAVLVITSVGYERQELLVKNKTFITTQLRVAVGNLDELQVIAYGTTTSRLNTGNVITVKASDIEKQPVNNPLLTLQGRVPGLVVTQNSGVAGGGVTVRIQGQNSILNGSDPFYVIDGVPYINQIPSTGLGEQILGNSGGLVNGFVTGVGNPLSYINPADIESIEVLKDADATAIYGSRAANGAILITTKKGKSGANKVDINMQHGFGKVTRKMEMLNTRQYLDMRYEALMNDGIDINTISPTNARYYDLKVWDTTRYTDWQKELIGGSAQYTDINASTSGGTDYIQYIVGGMYHRETTVFPGRSSDEKASIHFNINSQSVNRKFHIQLSGTYLMDNNRLPQADLTNNAILFEPIAPVLLLPDGSLNWQPSPTGRATFDINPMAALKRTYRNKANNLITNAVVGYKILPGLDIRSSLGYTKMQVNEFGATPASTFPTQGLPLQTISGFRKAYYGFKDIHSWIIEPQINYVRQISKSKINVLAGATIQQYKDNGFYIEGQGYSNDNVLESINAATIVIPRTQFFSEYKYIAAFGRINYNYQDKYIVNLNVRRDGSSRFGIKSQFHSFGSVGAAWLFSEEPFWKKSFTFVSFGKLRASYGITGNDQIGDYRFMNLYNNTSVDIAYQGTAGLQPEGLTNPYLEWESTRKLSLGIDIGIIKDKILLNLTYARNRSSNQLLDYALPQIAGFGSVIRNFPATIQNTSLEIFATGRIFSGSRFVWNTSFNFTIPRNKLIAFPGIDSSSYASTYVVGEPLSIQKVFHHLGVDPVNGRYLVADSHGDPTSSPDYNADRTILVSSLPRFYGGISNSLSYNGFQLDFLFQFVSQKANNFKYFNGVISPGRFGRGQSNQSTKVLSRWKKAGDIASIQKYSTSLDAYTGYLSDAAFSDASYIRLKNLSLSYELPKKWMKKVNIRNCRLYLHGQNLITITDYSGLDPENQSLSSLPPLRVITIGLQLGL